MRRNGQKPRRTGHGGFFAGIKNGRSGDTAGGEDCSHGGTKARRKSSADGLPKPERCRWILHVVSAAREASASYQLVAEATRLRCASAEPPPRRGPPWLAKTLALQENGRWSAADPARRSIAQRHVYAQGPSTSPYRNNVTHAAGSAGIARRACSQANIVYGNVYT